ncbi:MAG: CoA pyrophosphatase [Actinobacteria bacterium]|nr:CoA pyrophosphatase [Actinomycetota bacterium]
MSDIDPNRVNVLVESGAIPHWYRPLLDAISGPEIDDMTRFRAPQDEIVRHSSVLVLFGGAPAAPAGDELITGGQPDVLLIQRALDMRSHAGQPAFPGGAQDPTDAGPIATALREAQEETLLDPAGVVPVATLPQMWIRPSGFVVTPVLGWWKEPSPVSAGDPAEVASVHRVPIPRLVEPNNRVQVSHPAGYIGSGFEVDDMLVWGFTGMLLDRLIALAGWERPWLDSSRTVPFDDGWRQPGVAAVDS